MLHIRSHGDQSHSDDVAVISDVCRVFPDDCAGVSKDPLNVSVQVC